MTTTALLASAVAASTAQAHVRVIPDATTTGSFSALTFRVPNESATAGTVKVAVQLPQDAPFLHVSSKPVPGWTATSTLEKLPTPVDSGGTTITKAIRTVTWTADRGTQIAPGQYQEFSLSVGPLPSPRTILLPAVQTLSDGTVVSWDQPTPASGDEPDHPAPELVVTAAAASAGPAAPADPVSGSPVEPSSAQSASSDTMARWLGGAALVVALVGLAVAVAGRRRGVRA
ncbi:MAG: YcnI family copper-binding membrane protein [Propionibacteriaceae bacterium]